MQAHRRLVPRLWRLRREIVFRPGVRRGWARILDRYWNAFRHGLRDDPLARVEPVTLTFKPEAKVVKARGRVYFAIKTAWLATCVGTLVASGLVVRNMQAMWARRRWLRPRREDFAW